MGIRLKKRLFPFIREIIIITIVTTSTNPLKTLGKKRDRRWNETTAKGEKKEERRRLGNRKQRKEKEEEKNEERRKGADLPPRGDTAATSSINNIASWPRSFDIWKIRRGHPYPQPPLPPRLPPPRSTPAAESLLEFKMAGSGCTVRGQPSFPPHVRLLPAGTFLFLRVGISPPLPDPRIRLSS